MIIPSRESIKSSYSQVLKVIVALCFLSIPVFSYAYTVHYPATSDELLGLSTSRLFYASTSPTGAVFQNINDNWPLGDGTLADYLVSEAGNYYAYVMCNYDERNGYRIGADDSDVSAPFEVFNVVYCQDGVVIPLENGENKTRILSLVPEQGSTTPPGNDVFFRAEAWIGEDPTFWDTIKIELLNEDLNTIWSEFSTSTKTLYFGNATTTGLFSFSTTTNLADGDYVVTFSLQNATLGGYLYNPFGGDTQSLSHTFTVGSSTYLGSINRTYITDLQQIYASSTATTTQALLDACKPWDWGGFNVKDCLTGLLLPDQPTMRTLMEDFKEQIMQKVPWGYAVRLFAIISNTTTSTPPVLVFAVPDDPYFSAALRNASTTFNPWEVVSSGSVLDDADGFGAGNLMDVFMPIWKIIVYGLLLWGVSHKVLGHRSKRHYQVRTSET